MNNVVNFSVAVGKKLNFNDRCVLIFREYRAKADLSLGDIELVTRIPAAVMSRWENRDISPKFDQYMTAVHSMGLDATRDAVDAYLDMNRDRAREAAAKLARLNRRSKPINFDALGVAMAVAA